jgi:hypothetical protein
MRVDVTIGFAAPADTSGAAVLCASNLGSFGLWSMRCSIQIMVFVLPKAHFQKAICNNLCALLGSLKDFWSTT